ncbi:hypothetical protein EQO05_00940 [Methanosarcina sp. MSH10X1]|uniref:hypothetical protein n=1 Tax=Methanosarcina sp. MSH10X1 TaxID=2507075 RepID=UPI000FFC8A54|nr:hypothetical protein [Methanosarcina sp. MSH10X1]RXA21834.1 hypothetical protein EQO05_00940 [Methanosarcina sp. MSH10X1]
MRKYICLVVIVFITLGMGCISSSDTTDKPAPAEMNISETPDGKPLVEYTVSTPYTQDKDEWMKEYAQDHRTGDGEELHLFTFSDGKQFEYYMLTEGVSEKGFVYPSSWTEEPDESLTPTKISEEQCIENLEAFLSKWDGAYFEMQPDDNFGEKLYVYTGQPLVGLSPSDAAVILKNYIDYNPDRDEYCLVIQTPAAEGRGTIIKVYGYEPKKQILFESEIMESVPASNTIWTDATYTSIVNAIETNTFTNHPGKMGYPES